MSDHDKAHIDHTASVLLAKLANTPIDEQLAVVRDALQYAYACGCMAVCP